MNAKDLIEYCKGKSEDELRGIVIPSVWEVGDVEQIMREQSVKKDDFTYDEKVKILDDAIDECGGCADYEIRNEIIGKVVELKEANGDALDGDEAFDSWGGYGPKDLYATAYVWLKDALESGKLFDSGWHGFRKELCEMRVVRDGSGVKVDVSSEIDGLDNYELIDDCLTGDEQTRMTEEMYERILGILDMDMEFSTEAEDSSECMDNPTVEQIMEKAHSLLEKCNKTLDERFRTCKETTLRVLYEGDERLDEILKDRLGMDDEDNEQKENEE